MCVRAIMSMAGWWALLCGGCQGPPGDVAPHPAPDAATADAPTPDAPPDAALPDATPPDALAPDVAPPDAADEDLNPFGITLTDITTVALPDVYRAGRIDEDDWAFGAGAALGDVDGDG